MISSRFMEDDKLNRTKTGENRAYQVGEILKVLLFNCNSMVLLVCVFFFFAFDKNNRG